MNTVISEFDGKLIDTVVKSLKDFAEMTHLEDGTDLDDVVNPGFYYSWGSANTAALDHIPTGMYGGFILIVIRGGYLNNTVHQVILTSTSGGFFWRKCVDITQYDFIYWDVVTARAATYKVYGTTAQRVAPTEGGSRPVIGEQYFDLTLKKPIFYVGDSRDANGQLISATGWVDATGASV